MTNLSKPNLKQAKIGAEARPAKIGATRARKSTKPKVAPTPPNVTAVHHGASAAPTPIKSPSKRDRLAAMLVRHEGATIAQMQETLGWLPHTVRAAMTGLRKLGYVVDSDKVEGLRTYRAVAPR